MSGKLYGLIGFNATVVLGSAAQHGWFGTAKWRVPDECTSLVCRHNAFTKQFYYQCWDIVGFRTPLMDELVPIYGWRKVWSPRFIRPVVLTGKSVHVRHEPGQFSSMRRNQ